MKVARCLCATLSTKFREPLKMKVGVAEHRVYCEHAPVVMAHFEFVRHSDAAVDLDGVLANEPASPADESFAA